MSNDMDLSTLALEGSVLHVRVGADSLADAAARLVQTVDAMDCGAAVEPYVSVGFAQMGQMLAVFTPKRWELVAALRAAGACTVAALARQLGRDYKNVHTDVAALEQWMAVQRLPDGRVHVPWREIVMDMHLPQAMAA